MKYMNNMNKVCKKAFRFLPFYLFAFLLLATACSDDFLKEKKNYGNFDSSNTYGSVAAATERLNSLYFWLLPTNGGDGNGTNKQNDWTSIGLADKWAKSTEEYGGFSMWVDPSEELTFENVYDYFFVANDTYSPWGHIRNCNDIIEGVQGSSTISEEDKKPLLGQALFFRAYTYFNMVKLYGGVPIIDYVQDPIGSQGASLAIPRQNAKTCIDFICKDLERAAEYLPAKWSNDGADFGRITAGLAQALKGWVLLYYASPLFNRSNDAARWTAAYEANKKAIELLNQGGIGLAYATNGGDNNAANWNRLWTNYDGSDGSTREGVFVTLYNTNDNVSGQPDYGKWNTWENSIRPKNTNGNGGLTPTAEMVDLFPMADGKKPGESAIPYDKKKFWLNRDPRFYRTFAFPGTEWQFDEGSASLSDPSLSGVVPYITNEDQSQSLLYKTGKEYQLWSYQWNDNADDLTKVTTSSGYWADNLGGSADKTSGHSVYVRKRTQDYHLNSNTLYQYIISNSNPKGFQKCAAPLLSIRYAEVLLNYAEAAAMAGHTDEALSALQQIRSRVGYTADNNYGLPALTDAQSAVRACLYERQVELAFEGKRFDDMHRWMLFDGGVGQEALKTSWAVSGFGGNTCTWLGVTPLNSQKRHSIVLYCTTAQATDPAFAGRPAALTLDESLNVYDTASGANVFSDGKVEALATFYDTYLERKDVNADGNDDALTIHYLPKYYFLGLKRNAMQNNVTLHQTVGWHDLGRNVDGKFDPLSDTLPE